MITRAIRGVCEYMLYTSTFPGYLYFTYLGLDSVTLVVCVGCVAEKILFGLPPTVTVVKDNDSILDAVRRNSVLPTVGEATSAGIKASLSTPPPLITHTDATPQGSPNDSLTTGQLSVSSQLLQCPPFNPNTPRSTSHQQVRVKLNLHPGGQSR